MPIKLDDASSIQNFKAFDPKFFSKKLTGSGKSTGILCANANPAKQKKFPQTLHDDLRCKRSQFFNGQATISHIPFYIIPAHLIYTTDDITIPDTIEMTHILNENGHDIYIKMVPYSATLEETTSKTAKASKKFHVCYEIAVFNIADTTCKTAEPASIDAIVKTKSHTNKVFGVHTCNPKEFVEDLVYTRMVNTSPSSSSTFDANLKAFYNNYDLYDAICHRSEEWQANAAKTVSDYLDAFAPSQKKANIYSVIDIVQQLETYNIPLNLYRDIYHHIAVEYNDTELTEICKHNLNLLMSNTLDHLNTVKNTLTSLPVPQVEPAIDPMYSKEQAAAITTKEPLALVQSVAGSGKSSVILARIKYMVESGIDPNDITVLSFTNAAANHISDLNPDVHSMTIAKMIHTIYTNNFDKHQLSSIDTIINSLDIYMPDDQFAYEFKKRLRSTAKADRDAFTTLNNFIEENYDEVMKTLDIIGQTSLELEIIICYQKIDTLAEPPEVKSKYFIIDEVQDNSIFEFIYTLKYVDKNKESLFIVGDASQTLYEFRASNPRALNVLESSNVFTNYKMQTNYRSNQEILDFANKVLSNIEANQYANLRLRANSLAATTADSFKTKVNLHYERVNKISDIDSKMPHIIAANAAPYLDEKYKNKEKVAFLAYTRRDVDRFKSILTNMYPGANIVSLVPDKIYNSTIFSEFIKRYWQDVTYMTVQNIIPAIQTEIINKLDSITHNGSKAINLIQIMLADWAREDGGYIAEQVRQYMNSSITRDQFFDELKKSMLRFEIRRNAIQQSMQANKNAEEKRAEEIEKADFVVSTIHSAKGLEFENVVVLYRESYDTSEEMKRMYYVALTRAMQSEYVIAYDIRANPKIVDDYNSIVEQLENGQPVTA